MPTVKVTASGKAAHAGIHHAEGKNAIWALSQFILRVSRAHPQVSWQHITGGQSRNTVPDHAEVTLVCTEDVMASLDLSTDVDGTKLVLERQPDAS